MPEELEIIGLTKIFNKKTINFISNYLKIENIISLYLANNGIESLKFLKNINFNRLRELWLKENKISEITELNYLKNKNDIKQINLDSNNIKSIDDKIINVLCDFPNLDEIIISQNPFPKNDNSKKIIKEIENKNIRVKIN